MRKYLFAEKQTFAIFSAPHITIITLADCTTTAVVAFGVFMASVSVAWVIYCEDIGQRIHYMLLSLQVDLCDLHKWYNIRRIFHSIHLFSVLETIFHRFSNLRRHINSFVKVFGKLKTKSTTNNLLFCNHYRNWKLSDQWRNERFQPGENVAYRAHWQYCSRALG